MFQKSALPTLFHFVRVIATFQLHVHQPQKRKKMKVIPDQKICWNFVLKKKIDSFFTVYHHFYDILKVQNGLSALEN